MQIIEFVDGRAPKTLERIDQRHEGSMLWVDFIRGEHTEWPELVAQLAGLPLLHQHVIDGNNAAHPSHYDGTSDYDLVVFQGLGPDIRHDQIETRTAAFFLFDSLLVTVRAPDNVSFQTATKRLLDRSVARIPNTSVGMAHFVLDVMVDRYLAIREPLGKAFEDLQESLLDPDNPFNDWKALLNTRKQARKLESLSGGQLEALDAWRRQTRFDLTDSQMVRLNDLAEHIARVQAHASAQQTDVESAVQLHFSAVAHATNQTVTTLTILSAVFLPLGLVAGIFGMNFDNMPELHYPYAYHVTLGCMALLAGGLLLFFRRRGFFSGV
ncbi:magnesium transporter CorA family protein [Abyssibacter sp.]|uniref:magnesium transporter CorA family protein n=1 Tax=Abyssibacter sp. TaxID=2320200 RepID=UPI0025C66999|nr:magnesium transporter CorA family protein [Abyssibacter sp.]MCK5858604.1 magnesium transporter CorA family protein [Abyssibacter sp.]